jgi:hypothetical protein
MFRGKIFPTARMVPVLRYHIVYEEPVTSVDHPFVGLIKQDFRIKETKGGNSRIYYSLLIVVVLPKKGEVGMRHDLAQKNASSLN